MGFFLNFANTLELSHYLCIRITLQSNDDLASVSRADIAEVCVSSLLDPNALNKSVYMTKAKRGKSTKLNIDEDITSKFERLEADLY
jgi:hypothetical protein